MRDTVAVRLREQNHLAGWIDCEARGRSHRWVLTKVQYVGENPVAAYIPCARCPVSRRKVVGKR